MALSPRGVRVFSVLIGVALTASVVAVAGWETLGHVLDATALPFSLAVLCDLSLNGIVVIRWRALADALAGYRLCRLSEYFRVYILSRAAGVVLPRDVSEIGGRAVWLKVIKKRPVMEAGASVLLDRFFDLAISLLLLCAVLPFWMDLSTKTETIPFVVSLIALGGVVSAFFAGKALRLTLSLTEYFPKVGAKLAQSVAGINLPNNLWFTLYCVSLAKFAVLVGRAVFVAAAFELEISPFLLFLATPLGQLSYLLAVTPGGLGIYEAGWFGVLVLAGIDEISAGIFVIGQRLVLTAGVVLLLIPAALITKRAI